MTREDKRDAAIAALILLLALLLAGWAYHTYKPEIYVTTVTPTRKTLPPQVVPAPPETTVPVARPTGTVPVATGPVGANGTPVPELPGRVVPVPPVKPVSPVTGDTQVSRGLDHRCGLRDGKVFCVGSNKHGQLGKRNGDGSVALPIKAEQVVAGQGSTCALGEGRVFCWGFRQGLNATSTDEPRELAVPNAARIYNGEGGTVCSVTLEKGGVDQNTGNDPGALYCWGEGVDPQRGFTGRSWSDHPVLIGRSDDFDDVAVGWRSLCVLTLDVVLKCFGGQPDGSHDPAGRVIGKDTGWNRVTVHRKDETHDQVCAYYRDGSKLCFG